MHPLDRGPGTHPGALGSTEPTQQRWLRPLAVLSVILLSACAAGAPTTADDPLSPPPTDVPILDVPDQESELMVDVGCMPNAPRTPYADVSWPAEWARSGVERVDVTVYKDGFERGYFVTLDLTSPQQGFVHGREERKLSGEPYAEALSLRRSEAETRAVPGRRSVRIAGLDAGLEYFFRVLARTEDGWIPTETARQTAPTCVVDYIGEEG